MKKFLLRVFFFIGIIIVTVVVDVVLQKNLLFKDEDLKLPKEISILIFGHSHPANAYNTEYIQHAVNLGEPGEAYIYTYYKAKKVIENNPQIKKVFIEFTNNQIDKGMDDWLWDDVHLQYRIKSYGVLLDKEAIQLLYKKNSTGFINAFSKSLFDNIGSLFTNKKNLILKGGMGKFMPTDKIIEKPKSDSIDKKRKLLDSISAYNILYLQKLVKYCQDKKMEVCLVRSPMHKSYDVSYSESVFKTILHQNFKDVKWLDNKNFPLPDKGFQDSEHLNSFGAKVYSQYFNEQVNENSNNIRQ
ncbi:hypothetical protein [Flavobacterium psychrotolerans]|uniref:DUF1574 domain-containing protein n=1 Tax=Flavobacterium psychrotolerans TaxID=2169410 RepID=A0A2U1JI87_9FLAO|nr:hypothetical protein [Flavobacterium psychrotolerans]PWA04847.1 hypothetical protein DB895_08760 [Flavobacterium psychrotolerans]